MCAYGMCIPARIPVAYASVYPAYGPSQMSLAIQVSMNLSAHDSKMFDFLAPGQPQAPGRSGLRTISTWTKRTLDNDSKFARLTISLVGMCPRPQKCHPKLIEQ